MRQPTLWAAAPPRPAPPADEVHVWRAPLVQGPAELSALAETLSPDERRRAERFHFRRDRESFVAARGALRDILGRYLGSRPELIRFTQNEFGKPALGGAEAGGPLRFNLSHAHETALVAVACGREVGVDVEFVREDCAGLDIAERFFSAVEVAALRGLPHGQRTRAFFDCWTRKEAYIKARGEGLSMPLKQFAVSLTPGEPAALLWAEDDPSEVSRWSLTELDPGPGYVGALASEGAPAGRRYWQWQG